jgi:hypothetical protein
VNPINIIGLGGSFAQSTNISETNFTGNFGESDTCSGIASVTTSNSSGPSATYTVTASSAGSCHAIFSDGFGQTLQVNIVVTTSGFTIQSKHRTR